MTNAQADEHNAATLLGIALRDAGYYEAANHEKAVILRRSLRRARAHLRELVAPLPAEASRIAFADLNVHLLRVELTLRNTPPRHVAVRRSSLTRRPRARRRVVRGSRRGPPRPGDDEPSSSAGAPA